MEWLCYKNSNRLRNLTELIGLTLEDDSDNTLRPWTVVSVYAPITVNGGYRCKLQDPYGFISFLEQEEFEVIMGWVRPGDKDWRGRPYPDPEDSGWIGLDVDEYDLQDDLLDRVFDLCRHTGRINTRRDTITRRIYKSRGNIEETWAPIDSRNTPFVPVDLYTPKNVTDYWVRIEHSIVRDIRAR